MKKIVTSIIAFIILILVATSVSAVSGIIASLSSNTNKLLTGQEVVLTFKYDQYTEINKGINAYKATLEYDTEVFEEVVQENFKPLNNWGELRYNKNTKEFVSIKKERSNTPEEVIQIVLKVKENANVNQTTIKIKDIVASEGIVDINAFETEVKIDIINQVQTPVTTPENSENKDNSSSTVGTTKKEETVVEAENLSPNLLPKAGTTYSKLLILLVIEILIINIVIVRRKQKQLDREISKRLKMILTCAIVGVISLQGMGIIYAAVSEINSKGELNDDKQINNVDVNLLELHLIHSQMLPENKLQNADINDDGQITVTDLSLLLDLLGKTIEYEVDLFNLESGNYYPNKNEEITLTFNANVNSGATMKAVVIDGQEYLAQKIDGTDDKYEVKLTTAYSAGINEYHITEILLSDDSKAKTDQTLKVDVLKEIPNIELYSTEENMSESKAKLFFYVSDFDNSIISSKMEILNESGEKIKEYEIIKGKNEIDIDISSETTYEIKFTLNYDLDTNQLTEHEKDNTGVVEISKKLVTSKSYRDTTSMYSWYEQTLVKDALPVYQALEELNVKTLYQDISSSYMTKEYLEPIVKAYNKQGIEMYRLIGDPSWAYNNLTRPKKMIDEIHAYNQSVDSSAKLKGVNLDVEPHVDDRWDDNPQAAFTQYINSMIELYNYAKQYNLEVVICTNTWFSSYEGYEKLYEKAADTFSIMNYVKSSNIKGIKEEVEIAAKYNKNIETIAHSSAGSAETESYHNDNIDKLLQDHSNILKTYSYANLRASYHHFTTIEYLKDKDVYLQLEFEVTDNSGEPTDLVLVDANGKEITGYIMEMGNPKSYIFPGVKENTNYQIKSTSHEAVGTDTITIPESPKGRATLSVELKRKTITETDNYTLMSDIDYKETLEDITNPERGFYYPISTDMKVAGNEAINPKQNLVHLRIGIGAFSGAANGDKDLQFTEDMLNSLNTTLANIKSNGGSAIVRFAYDNFDGKENLEPSLDMILTHISQLKPVFDQNKDVIAYVELGFFGPWGEMHSSDICTTENVSKAIDEMLKATPNDMKIGVRTPEYYAAWAKIDRSKLNTNITKEGTDSYRIGLYNDGYLGSESDLGTFDNREIEISWLEKQALHTLYGGEVVANRAQGEALNTIEYISKEAFRTHTTYLNSKWNDKVLDTWKSEIYNGNDELYKGQTGYLYVANHLGYRFVLRKSQVTSNINKNMNLKLKLDIENVGFGNLVNDKIATIVLEKNGKTHEVTTTVDATTWNSTEISNVNLEIDLPKDIEIGEWNIYLRLSQYGNLNTDNNYNCIRLANNGIWKQDIGANYIGKIQIVENN